MTYEKCRRCNEAYDVSPFACMRANGERSDATVEVYGDKYNLCPKCTSKLYDFIHNLEKPRNVNVKEIEKVEGVLKKHNAYIISKIDGKGVHMGEIKQIALDANDAWIVETDIESISIAE